MTVKEIKEKARYLMVTPRRLKKAELIHAVQTAEGYSPCFGKSNGECPHTECCFRNDCTKINLL